MSATAEELLGHAAARLAGFKRPRSVEFVDALPMSATGKVLKKELRARHPAGTATTSLSTV